MSLHFNGTSDRLARGSNTLPAYPFTIFAWTLGDATLQSGNVAMGFQSGSPFLQIGANSDASSMKAFCGTSGGTGQAFATRARTAADWVPVMVVFNSASSRDIYYGTGAVASNTTSVTSDPTATNSFSVGGEAGAYWKGDLGHVAIWSSALTLANFQSLGGSAAGGSGNGVVPSTVASGTLYEYWSLASAAATQTGVNGRVLTATGTTTASSEPPVATPLTFTGTIPSQSGAVGSVFSWTGAAASTFWSGGTAPYTYSVQSGTLQAGLSLSSSTGVISGTPSAAGVATLVLRVTDSAGTPATADSNSFTLTVTTPNPPPTFSGPSIGAQSANVGGAYSLNVAGRFSDPSDTLTYSAVGTFPPGITVSSAGVISGTPTTAGTYPTLKVRATDTAAQTVDSDTFTFTVGTALVSGGANILNQNGAVGQALVDYDVSARFTGGTAPYTYSAVGTWPAGVTVNSSTGVISGTPTVAGTYSGLAVRATDAASAQADTSVFTFTIAASGVVTTRRSIGTGGDYSDPWNWGAAVPASCVAANIIWQGECLLQEFTVTDGTHTPNYACRMLSTTDLTRYMHLTTAPGCSFRDHASKNTNPGRYNPAVGAAINFVAATSAAISLEAVGCRVSNLQIKHQNAGGTAGGYALFSSSLAPTMVFTNCIIQGAAIGAHNYVVAVSGRHEFHECVIYNVNATSPIHICEMSAGVSFYGCVLAALGGRATYGIGGGNNAETGDEPTNSANFYNTVILGCDSVRHFNAPGTISNCFSDATTRPAGFSLISFDTTTGTGFQSISSATPDFRLKATSALVNAGTTDPTGSLVDILGNARSGAPDVGAFELIGAYVPSISITLTTNGSTPAASKTGLKWAWFDQVTPDLFSAPTDKGTGESTDSLGSLVISIPNSTKTTGQVGWLIVTNSDGTTTQSPAHELFAGPVTVL